MLCPPQLRCSAPGEMEKLISCWDNLWGNGVTGDEDPTQQHQDGDATKRSHPRPLPIRAWRQKGTENQAREQGCVCRVLFMSSENSSPVLKQPRNAANAQTGARELPGRLILATNPGELQKLPVNSNPETFQNTFFPEESRGAACIFSNIHQRTGPSHTFKSRPRKYGKAEIILGSNPGTCHSACRTSYE